MKSIQYILLLILAPLLITACSGSNSGSGGDNEDPDPDFPTETFPDHDSMDLSTDILNPEAFNISGNTTTITVRLADQLNDRTVLDGQQVFFSAEGGSIDDFCTIVDGACTVTWTGQNPRPGVLGTNNAGRATILAWTLGHESFIDNNSNGFFDDGDTFPPPTSSDLPEPFRDDNWNGVRDIDEIFIDFDGDNTHDLADGLYSGINCAHSTLCATSQSLFIFRTFEIVMSGSNALINFFVGGVPAVPPVATGNTIQVTITDSNGNVMPNESAITAASTVGQPAASISSQVNSNGFGISFTISTTNAASGTTAPLNVTITTPGNHPTTSSIDLDDT